jgi:hypothetical protein
MKWCAIILLLQFNVLVVGQGLTTFSYGMPPLIIMARASAWAAAINLTFVSLAVISPVLRLLFQLNNFNIMHHAFHTIHFHRNAAVSAIFFSILHIALITVYTKQNECTIKLSNTSATNLDLCSHYTIISGAFIILGMVGASLTGHFSRFRNSSSVLSLLHFPLACLTCLTLYLHSSNTPPNYPFASYLVASTLITGLIIHGMFFYFNPIQPMHVNKSETVWLYEENLFTFLVVNYHNSSVIPPGSFYLIYSNQDSHLKYFHAHSFPVFSSQNRRISFLVHCRVLPDSNQISFTQRLSQGI